MKERATEGRLLKRLVAILILLSLGLLVVANIQDWAAKRRNKAAQSEAAAETPTPTPTPSPAPGEPGTVQDLLSGMELKSQHLKEPNLEELPNAEQAPATPAAETPPEPETVSAERLPANLEDLPHSEWPTEVHLLKTAQFPLFMNGKPVGSLTANPGHVARVLAMKSGQVELEFRQSRQWMPVDSTDFKAQAVRIRSKRQAAGQPIWPQTSGTNAPAPEPQGTPAPTETPSPSATAAPSATPSATVAPSETPPPQLPSPSGPPADSATQTGGTMILRVTPAEDSSAPPPGTFFLIQQALDSAQELAAKGTPVRIIVSPGVYKENLKCKGPATAAGSLISIETDRPGQVQISGTIADTPVIQLEGAIPIALKGLAIIESQGTGIRMTAMSAPVLIEHCVIRDNNFGVLADGVPKITIVQSAVADNRDGQLAQLKEDTSWDLRQSTFAALKASNLGNLVEGLPSGAGVSVRVDHCIFFHPSLENAFRQPDASLLNFQQWSKLVSDTGSVWSKEQAEAAVVRSIQR